MVLGEPEVSQELDDRFILSGEPVKPSPNMQRISHRTLGRRVQFVTELFRLLMLLINFQL